MNAPWGGVLQRAAPMFLGAGIVAVAVARARRRFTRYAVAGESMVPALFPGDFVVIDIEAYHGGLLASGEVVLARDPREPSRRIIKRVRRVDAAGAWLEGDNHSRSTDSRHFGPVEPASIIGRAAWRYWPPRRFGPIS